MTLYDAGSLEIEPRFSVSQNRPAPGVLGGPYARALSLVALTMWLLTLCLASMSLEKSRWATGSEWLSGILLCLGGLSLLASVQSWGRCVTAPAFGNYTRLVFTALLLWCALTIVRFDWLNKWEIKQVLGGRYFGWAWVVPASMILGSDLGIWKRALGVAVSTGAAGLILLIAGWGLLSLHSDFGFTRSCSIALLFYHYFGKRARRIILLGTLTTVFLSTLAATRNEVFGHGLMILFASYIGFFRRQLWRPRTRVFIITGYSIAFIAIVIVASVDRVPFAGDTINDGIVRFKEKLYTDTRNVGADDSLFTQFSKAVNGLEYVIGCGCRGSYDFDAGTRDRPFLTYERNYIECGYLQIILHGGVVSLILILALTIPAIYLGMFRSKNWFTRGCAFVVLGRLLEMFPFGLPVADTRYVFFWMAVGACLTYRLRMIADADIGSYFGQTYPATHSSEHQGKQLTRYSPRFLQIQQRD